MKLALWGGSVFAGLPAQLVDTSLRCSWQVYNYLPQNQDSTANPIEAEQHVVIWFVASTFLQHADTHKEHLSEINA